MDQKRLDRIRQLNNSEQEAKALRQRVAELEDELGTQRQRHEEARNTVVKKVQEMERLTKLLIEERNALANKIKQLERGPPRDSAGTQFDALVEFPPETADSSEESYFPRTADAAVDATRGSMRMLHSSARSLLLGNEGNLLASYLPPSSAYGPARGINGGSLSQGEVDNEATDDATFTPLPTAAIVFALEVLRRSSGSIIVEPPPGFMSQAGDRIVSSSASSPWHVGLRSPSTDWWQWVPVQQPGDVSTGATKSRRRAESLPDDDEELQEQQHWQLLESKLRGIHVALHQCTANEGFGLSVSQIVSLCTSLEPSRPLQWSEVHLPDISSELRVGSSVFLLAAPASRSATSSGTLALITDVAQLGDEANLFLVQKYRPSAGASFQASDPAAQYNTSSTHNAGQSKMYFEPYLEAQWCPLDWLLITYDTITRIPIEPPQAPLGRSYHHLNQSSQQDHHHQHNPLSLLGQPASTCLEVKYQDYALDLDKGVLNVGLRFRGLPPRQETQLLEGVQVLVTTHPKAHDVCRKDDDDAQELYQEPCSLVPLGCAFKVMCPALIQETKEDSVGGGESSATISRRVGLTVTLKIPLNLLQQSASSSVAAATLMFVTCPKIHPQDGLVEFQSVRIPHQVDGPYTEIGSSVPLLLLHGPGGGRGDEGTNEPLSRSVRGMDPLHQQTPNRSAAPGRNSSTMATPTDIVLFSPLGKDLERTRHHGAQLLVEPSVCTRDIATNTNHGEQYQADDDIRFHSHSMVISEMQQLQQEFTHVEVATLKRLSWWLNAQADLLNEHHDALLELSQIEFSMALWSTSYTPISSWMTDSFDLISSYLARGQGEMMSTIEWLHMQARTHRDASFHLCNATEGWITETIEGINGNVVERVTLYAEDSPKMALSTTQADMVWPGEVELIHQVHRYANSMQEVVDLALGRSKLLTEIIMQQGLSFVHHVITTLDERDDQIDALETKLIKPITYEKGINARTNTGDIAAWSAERCQLLLKMGTLETYVPDLVLERNELLSYKRKMDTEAAHVGFHIDSLNDRCEALGQECEALGSKLVAAAERESGAAIRHKQDQSRQDQLQFDLFNATAEIARFESSKHSRFKNLEDENKSQTLKISALETEIELLREGMLSSEAPSVASTSNVAMSAAPLFSGRGGVGRQGGPQAGRDPVPEGQMTVAERLAAKQSAAQGGVLPSAVKSQSRSRPWLEGAKVKVASAAPTPPLLSTNHTPEQTPLPEGFSVAQPPMVSIGSPTPSIGGTSSVNTATTGHTTTLLGSGSPTSTRGRTKTTIGGGPPQLAGQRGQERVPGISLTGTPSRGGGGGLVRVSSTVGKNAMNRRDRVR